MRKRIIIIKKKQPEEELDHRHQGKASYSSTKLCAELPGSQEKGENELTCLLRGS